MKPEPEGSHFHGRQGSKQLNIDSWPDFERLFASNGGVWGGCWCMFYHHPGGFDPRAYGRNKRAKRELVRRGGAHGTLVYCGEDPVGWCQFGPREELGRIDRKRGYSPASPDPWRITCFFIAPGHRKLGLAEYALGQSISAMEELGVMDVEAYPVEGKTAASSLWSGTPGLFRSAGFRRVASLGRRAWVYTLHLGRQ